ncbi:MAG TPA: single-stranded-DNA-specific exonuclease RecJ, partial [Blastocatellia bacterium]|nr:single-stranded-DNA-specific exonuclease RecJ [Blastocatellia bacterium]
LGLAASRIAERLYRPAIALAVENGKASGSGRSIEGFDLLGALDSCADILVQYGGHRAAAGMTIESQNIPEFRNRLNNYAREVFGDDEVQRVIEIDALVSPESLTVELVREIELLEPFGHGNPRPMFATRGLYLRQDPFVMKEKHLKLHLSDDKGRRFEAIWWNGVEKSQGQTLTSGLGIKIAYTAEIDSWQGNTRLQLVITDLKSDN